MMKPEIMPLRSFTVIIILGFNYKFMIYKISLVVLILLSTFYFLLSSPVFADVAQQQDFVYLFHLYYDNGQLFADRDFQFKYDVLPETFVPETISTQFPYRGDVINLKGEVAKTFQFDPQQGNQKFLKGKLSVKGPYIPDAQKVNFYDGQGNQLLSVFVSDSSFCNDDGVCNSDVGEDSKTCPSDCKNLTSVPTVSTEPSMGNGGGGMLKGIIYLIIGLGIAGGFWWLRKQKTSQSVELPPNFPTPPSPQNPAQ